MRRQSIIHPQPQNVHMSKMKNWLKIRSISCFSRACYRCYKYVTVVTNTLPLLQICNICSAKAFIQKRWVTGTTLYIFCRSSNHKATWYSQAELKGMFAGNLLLSAFAIFTGGTFTQISEMFKPFNLPF